jgi:hypothetical protein
MMLCLDTPDSFREQLKLTMGCEQEALDFNDPFALHIPLIDQIIAFYDRSVWNIRDLIRQVEKVSQHYVSAN